MAVIYGRILTLSSIPPLFLEATSFPAIKEVVIICPVRLFHGKVYVAAVVELTREAPFKHMDFRTRLPFPVVGELVALADTAD